jgi:hypothetical protein
MDRDIEMDRDIYMDRDIDIDADMKRDRDTNRVRDMVMATDTGIDGSETPRKFFESGLITGGNLSTAD